MGTCEKVQTGFPYPLGASHDGNGVNFALFSANAERVELCLFDDSGEHELTRITLPENTDHIWHGYVPKLALGQRYAYRVYGPYEPHLGHRFNHHKLLLDPYARKLQGDFRWAHQHYGYQLTGDDLDLSFDTQDNAAYMPKCVVVASLNDSVGELKKRSAPHIPWSETIIYETHVRGFTMRHEGVPLEQRGTFAGLTADKVIDYLRALGITSIELMPIQYFIDESFIDNKGLRNYWGYNPIGFFLPMPRYSSNGDIRSEFRTMVERLHDAGIEVLLDVVYNHTAESNHIGPTLSFRGIDNASYYRLEERDRRFYVNDTGCGNTLNVSHPRVLQMVMDSLRYWVSEMHVDGFRFDLASTLGRDNHGFDAGSGFFDAICQDPVLGRVKLIAEPWDIGPGGYQLGHFPAGWCEWNDRYRDTVRCFWRGDEGVLPEFGKRLRASSDIFEHSQRRPWVSINAIATHDGFTLTDVVSYKNRHNHANGEENNDGHHANYSDNCGVEGETEDQQVLAIRNLRRRNMLATLFLSQGTPMLLAGDELGHSQKGNNNAYCQDNKTSWIDWSSVTADDEDFLQFVKDLIAIRRKYPEMRCPRFIHGKEYSKTTGLNDIEWFHANGEKMLDEHWSERDVRCVGMLLNGDAIFPSSDKHAGVETHTLLSIFNAANESFQFVLPQTDRAGEWHLLLDTTDIDVDRQDIAIDAGESHQLGSCSTSLFVLLNASLRH